MSKSPLAVDFHYGYRVEIAKKTCKGIDAESPIEYLTLTFFNRCDAGGSTTITINCPTKEDISEFSIKLAEIASKFRENT